jgi:hypothetical protein
MEPIMSETIITKICTKCKTAKSTSDFFRNKNTKDGFHPNCKICCNFSNRKYVQSEHGKKKRLEYTRIYIAENRDKARVRVRIYNAIRGKKITKPQKCSNCGGSGKRIEAHHHKGYDEAHWFDIVWLCAKCHKLADRIKQN